MIIPPSKPIRGLQDALDIYFKIRLAVLVGKLLKKKWADE